VRSIKQSKAAIMSSAEASEPKSAKLLIEDVI
jgi:hypothetical protein